MTRVLKRLDLLLREVADPVAQENFYRLRRIIEDISASGLAGPPGPVGPQGPPGSTTVATSAPKLVATFNTDVGTLVTDLVYVNGVNTVTKITDNFSSTIPNGIFGVGFNKPTSTTIDVIFAGIIPGYAGLTAGLPVFVSIAGVPTHTPPATGMVQQIGFAVSTTEIFISLMQAMRRS